MLTRTRLVWRNLRYHARGNLALLLGVAVGSAVLTGALLVGDSLRGSLRAQVERQLNGVVAAALLPRPVRADLADELPGRVAPVLLLRGSVQTTGDTADARYLGRVTVLGVDERFAPPGITGVNWRDDRRRRVGQGIYPPVVLSAPVAARLGVGLGDRIRLGIEYLSGLPRTSSFARRDTDEVTRTEELEVAAVLPPDAAENEFRLTPDLAAPLNVFVPIATVSRLATGDPTPAATALLAREAMPVDELNAALWQRLRAEDFGLKLREIPRRFGAGGYVSVESAELILGPATSAGVLAAARQLGLRAEPTVVYVADTLAAGDREIPYPVIAGVNPAAEPPLGPFLPPGVTSLADDEVILLEWDRSPLNGLPIGTRLRLTYYHPDVEGEGQLETAELTLRGYVSFRRESPNYRPATRDPNLTPEIAGVTDARANLYDWDRPPVLPNERIRQRVPDKHPRGVFFTVHRATPMAYVTLATARRLFQGRLGSDTSVRVAPATGEPLEVTLARLEEELPRHLTPPAGPASGFAFEPVRDRLREAGRGGTDFGGLFLGFSLFLIAAALMLVGLLFRLFVERRAKELGLLLAAGFAVGQVRRLLWTEALMVTLAGAAVGLAAAVGYNRLLLAVLFDLWPDPQVRTYLRPFATASSFVIGYGLTVLMAGGALALALRGLARVPPPALLRGETGTISAAGPANGPRWVRGLAGGAAAGALALLAGGSSLDDPDARAGTFFAGGGLLLVAALSGFVLLMRWKRGGRVGGRGWLALARLAVRNAARNPGRSLLVVALLAAASFLLVAVESFRRQPDREFATPTGGSGGFNLLAETATPVYQPFDRPPGREDLERQLRRACTPPGGDAEAAHDDPRYQQMVRDLGSMEEVLPLRVRDGDDASCANLFQASRPRILGVPTVLTQGPRRFRFGATLASTPEQRANPWRLLDAPAGTEPVPALCEQNTALWMLKVGLGDTLTLPGDDGRPLTFRIVGLLVDSPFQSDLLIAEAEFVRLFPKQAGYRAFLIRTAAGQEAAVARVLQVGLRAQGLTAEPTRDRVARYQAVIGAYLSTFQLLGGVGLLLGVVGLAVVILRGIWERQGELAVLRAVGYSGGTIRFVVMSEHAVLLAAGLATGTATALVSVAPHLAGGADVPWPQLLILLGLVAVVGGLVTATATAGLVRAPLIAALRRD